MSLVSIDFIKFQIMTKKIHLLIGGSVLSSGILANANILLSFLKVT